MLFLRDRGQCSCSHAAAAPTPQLFSHYSCSPIHSCTQHHNCSHTIAAPHTTTSPTPQLHPHYSCSHTTAALYAIAALAPNLLLTFRTTSLVRPR